MHPFLVAFGMLELMRRKGNVQKRNPVVFVPGLFGSMGDEIIPGTGDWGFGMSAPIYQPFIDSLEEMGYEKDKDLFIAFYDWRKECTFCARHYLKTVINQAKTKTRSKKVDIICYSMGGLIGRTYAQSKYYEYDVEQLIMIATPNAGAANTYYFWTEGRLPYGKDRKSNILRTILEGYLWVLKKNYHAENHIEMIHKHLKGAKDLLPSDQYESYLYFLEKNGNRYYIPYKKMKHQNHFLDQLNKNQYLLKQRKIEVTLIGGKGIETNDYLQLDRRYKAYEDRWVDGKIVAASKSKKGDGTVMLTSALLMKGDAYVFEATHVDILSKCRVVLRKKLGMDEGVLCEKNEKTVDDYVSILVSGGGDLAIKSAMKEGMIIYDGSKKIDGVYVENYNENFKWLILVGFQNDQLYMEYVSKESENIEILITDSFGRRKIIQEREVAINQTYRVNLS